MLETGQNLRQYRIERFLGRGGMGEVYLASDTKLHRKVALKILPSDTAMDHDRKKRFVREAVAASRLNHPNINVVYDADETEEGVAYISMEYIEGETLASRITRGSMPLDAVRSYGIQIADALDEAHRRGVIHRDLKPANVMVDRQGRVKILDFGLARLFETGSESLDSDAITLSGPSGSIAGTPTYMSPEQARGEQLDHRSDIFSFGVVLYEMITGLRPFTAPSVAAVFSRILTEEPRPIRDIRSDTSPDLERIISKALEKDRNRRYSSAREIAVDLRRLEGGSVDDSRSRMGGPRMSRRTVATVVATAALVGALLYFGSRPRSPSTDPIDSLAVLPLRDLSPKREGDYLADGMTEALISGLAQIRSLKVISRTSAMQYKNTQKSLPQIGRELGVDAVIEGSVAHYADQIRVSAQLIDARTDRHLWAQTYDRDLRDVLRLQDEIARTIADAVRVELLPAEQARLGRARQIDPRAHDLYVRARYEWSRRGPEPLLRSVDLLNQAIALEPDWPLAHAALADSYNLLANNGYLSRNEGFTKGKAAARRALELDPDLGQAHAALAFALWQKDLAWEAADREFRKAIELEPSYASAHHFFAMYLTTVGKDSEGLAEIRKALELDPLSPRIHTNYGDILRSVGNETEAIAQLEKNRALDPLQALRSLVFAYVHQQRPAEAMKAADEAAAIRHPVARQLQALAIASHRGKAALPLIHEVEGEMADSINMPKSLAVTAAYVVAGDHERAWKSFEPAGQLGIATHLYLREPLLEPLRKDPRYAEFLAKLKFPSSAQRPAGE